MKSRVVITGIGVLAPSGVGTDAFWSSCLSDRTVASKIPEDWLRASPLHSRVWSPLPVTPEMPDIVSRIEAKQLDPVTQNALFAAFEAVRSAGLALTLADEKKLRYQVSGISPERAGVYLGTGVGGISTVASSFAHQFLSAENQGRAPDPPHPKRFNPFTVSMLMPNAPAANLAIKLGLCGPCRSYCSACASSTVALGHGFRAVQSGEVDLAISGGTEYLFDTYGTIFRAFDELKTLAHGEASDALQNRPFDANRSGFLFSQGASVVLVMESPERAQTRGATPIAEIVAFAETCDAASIMMMDKEGVEIGRMLRRLLSDANLRAEQVDYINAHGTGTELNDAVESAVIARMFRKDVAINSTKALIGHTMGACGAVEAAVTALSLRDQSLHGSPNLDAPIAPLNFVRRAGPAALETAVSQSFAFGGHNAALLFKRFIGDGLSPH